MIRDISSHDTMFTVRSHYFSVGRSALHWIALGLMATGLKSPRSILDLPCGYGRVLRHLKARYPRARLAACDLSPQAIGFCAKKFGAAPVLSAVMPEKIRLPGNFDLIWCGSLLSHLPTDRWSGFLKLFRSSLSRRGILVFTTLGRWSADQIRNGNPLHRPFESEVRRRLLVRQYDRTGVGYGNYIRGIRYGVCLASPPAVLSLIGRVPGLRFVLFAERAWDHHQDVYVCARDTHSR